MLEIERREANVKVAGGWLTTWIVGIAMWIGAATTGLADPARRIASLNLCADQLLLSIVERERIVGLSPFSHRPSMAFLAETAAGLPALRGTAEEVIALKADVVIVGPFGVAAARDMLKARGIRVIEMPIATSITEMRRTIADIGAALGAETRAAALIARIDAALGEPPPQPGLEILPLERRGWIEGEQTIYAALLAAGGFVNAGARLTRTPWGGIVPLEQIVKARVPFAMMSGATLSEVNDQGAGMMVHPALAGLYPRDRLIITPGALMSCPVVSTPEIVAFLRGEHARLMARKAAATQ